MLKYFLLSLLLSFTGNIQANENDTLIKLLVVSKATGRCGIIQQLTAFQSTTKMAGGNEFLARFLKTEMARLGQTLPVFLEQCEYSISVYTDTMKELGFEE